jgi:uncharacterized radical SAM superfamily Fe-S cluster-containing enzyme
MCVIDGEVKCSKNFTFHFQWVRFRHFLDDFSYLLKDVMKLKLHSSMNDRWEV